MAEQSLRLSPDEKIKVLTFLTNNNVLEEWKNIFRDKCDLKNSVLEFINSNEYANSIPAPHNILRAFSMCSPEDIKVVIVGDDPIWENNLATGFSFSFPKGKKLDENVGKAKRPIIYEEGQSIAILHDVLVDADFLERGGTYDYCHEIWAKKGVLLLNAILTLNEIDIWEEFIKQILFQVAKKSEQEPLFFLFWGTEAGCLGSWLSSELKRRKYWLQTIRDGDHSESIDERAPLVLFIGDNPTFSIDGNKLKYKEQAVNQFRAIKKSYRKLFTLPNLACVFIYYL
uniref:Uracil-DNA glycosylase-like domain-containing protein n=1 Tax=Arion vulgaris TaxID=1028688 RepID=A0A0B6ZVT5_9EUPU